MEAKVEPGKGWCVEDFYCIKSEENYGCLVKGLIRISGSFLVVFNF
jgi:hypothetical protein